MAAGSPATSSTTTAPSFTITAPSFTITAPPTTTEAPPRQLWSATLTPGTDDYGGTLGNGVGFGASVSGVLDPQSFEYEPGAAAEFRRFLLLPDDDDRLYVAVDSGAGSGLEGLWLKVADHLAIEIGAPESRANADRWLFDIGEGSLDWSAGGTYEVSLWDKRPPLAPAPPRRLWSATLGAASGGYGNLGAGVGYGRGRAGSLEPGSYQPPAGCNGETAVFNRIVLLPEGDDKVAGADRVYVAMAGGSAQASCLVGLGLWLKVADHLAFELVEPTHERGDRWFFEIPQNSLDWSDGGTYEVSLWDKRPPLSPAPARQLWAGTLLVGTWDDSGNEFLGFIAGGEGDLTPSWSYEYEPGSSVSLDWFGRYPHNNTFRISTLSGDPNGLNGLWLKIGDDLALEMDAATRSSQGQRRWVWDLSAGALDWSEGDTVAVSLWDKRPPLSTVPPRQLWTATITVGEEDLSEGTSVGYAGTDSIGSISDAAYEYAPGSTLTFDSFLLLPDGDDTLSVGTETATGADALAGLWLKVSDTVAVEMDAAVRGTLVRDWAIGEGSLGWSDGDTVEVSLWDKNPISG